MKGVVFKKKKSNPIKNFFGSFKLLKEDPGQCNASFSRRESRAKNL